MIDRHDDFLETLMDSKIVVKTDDGVVLGEEFNSEWRKNIEQLRSRDRSAYLSSFFETEQSMLSLDRNPDDSVTVRQDRQRIGEWSTPT